jgi:putative sulfotransferase
MLSNMLREHPHVLSLSEFYSTVSEGGRIADAFSETPIDGRRFWAIVAATAPLLSFCLRHRVPYDECLYPCDDASARFTRQTGVPAILATALPHLTPDHDRLFTLLLDEVTGWSVAPIRAHYRRLFGWLTKHFGKRVWIERSGASLLLAEQIQVTFSDARFVHIVRDGRDSAISMYNHPGFKLFYVMNVLGQYLGVDPLESPDRTHLQRVPGELRLLLPEHFDADALRSFPVPLSFWGEAWAQQIDHGLKVLSALPENRLLTLRYEDFFVDPQRQLDLLAIFLGDDFINDGWAARCAATVRKPRSTWRDLPGKDARDLTEACRPGFELLREAGVHYDVST